MEKLLHGMKLGFHVYRSTAINTAVYSCLTQTHTHTHMQCFNLCVLPQK